MQTMHHLPHIFLRLERPDCPVLIPSSFSASRDRVIAQDIYSYEPCGLPTGNFMPAERAQIRLMTASPITLRACIPAPDQVTPEQAYFKDLDFYKKTRAQSHYWSTEMLKSFSRLTIGSACCPSACGPRCRGVLFVFYFTFQNGRHRNLPKIELLIYWPLVSLETQIWCLSPHFKVTESNRNVINLITSCINEKFKMAAIFC